MRYVDMYLRGYETFSDISVIGTDFDVSFALLLATAAIGGVFSSFLGDATI